MIHHGRRRRGATTLELALVLPVVVVLVLFIVDMARIGNAQLLLHRAVVCALDYGTQLKSAGEFPSEDEVRTRLLASVLPPLDPASVKIDRLSVGPGKAGGRATVSIAISYQIVPFTPTLARALQGGMLRLSTTGQLAYPQQGHSAPPAPKPTQPAFTITPAGDILINTGGSVRLKTLKKDFLDQAEVAKLTLAVATDGSSFEPIFGGDHVDGDDEVVISSLAPGADLAIEGHKIVPQGADLAYRTNRKLPFADASGAVHSNVLVNGDSFPVRPPDSQAPLTDALKQYVDPATNKVVLGPDQILVLFAFEDSLTDMKFAYGDLAIVLEVYQPGARGAK